MIFHQSIFQFRGLPPINNSDEILSFAIFPYYVDGTQDIVQCGGANKKTTGYKVFKRVIGDNLIWHDDWPTEEQAIECAQTLARFTGKPVEPYEWATVRSPSIAEQDSAFDEFAKLNPYVPSQGESGSQDAKAIWNGACEWMRRVFAAKM